MPGSEDHPRKFRFGPYELDEAARELRKDGVSVRLQDQPREVLRVLLERPGEVVSREDLRRRLWPEGTFVDYEQSLNKAVNKLREVLCDSADKPRYVETVVRRGYRFVAPVELERPKPPEPQASKTAPEGPKAELERPVEAPAPEKKPAPSHARLWWAAGLLVAAILVTGLWPVPEPQVKITTLISDEHAKNDTLAIAGGRITYEADGLTPEEKSRLWSVSTAGGEARREPSPCSEKTYTSLVDISILRQRLWVICGPENNEYAWWLTDFDGGNPQWVGRRHWTEGAVHITPDLTTLVYTTKEGLFAEPVNGGPKRQVLRADVANVQMRLFWHPAGGRIGFLRRVGNLLKVWEVRTDGSGSRPLIPEFEGEQVGAEWSPDGQRLYFLSNWDIYLQRGRGWLGWMRPPRPGRLTMGTAIFGPAYEDPSNPRVVYAEGDVIQAAAVKLNRRTNAWEPFLGGAPAEGVNFSPDGEWVAYVKWPDAQLWKCRRDGSGKVMLEDRLFSLGPYWSPDGTRLAFTARERTTRGEPDQPWHVYTISSSGGKPERVPGLTQPALGAAWSPDGKRIAFFPPIEDRSKLSKQPHILIVNLETGAVEPVPGTENIFDPRWSPDGKYLSARTVDDFKPAIYDFATRNWRILQPAGFGAAHWSKDSRYLYSTVEPGITLVRMDVATGKMEELRKLTEFKLASVMWPDVYWTPEDEPVALKQTILDQIYRIERDR